MITTVVIIGGGYAGVLCANRLRSSLTSDEIGRTRIRLVNASPDFVERIRLHEVIADTRPDAVIPLRKMLHPDVELNVGRAAQIDPENRIVLVADGQRRAAEAMERIAFDQLVYAVGSGTDSATPGVAENAYAVSDPEQAAAAQSLIRSGPSGQRVVVVGGGYTGVETAAEIAERYPAAAVTVLTSGSLVAPMRASARQSITRSLGRLGVTIRGGARVASVSRGAVTLDGGESIPFDVCLWAASFSVPDLAAASGLDTDEIGRLRVDASLRSIEFPHIVGAGDAVRLPDANGGHLRMGCAVALAMGGAAANTVLAHLRGKTPPVASVGFLFQCVSLGRRDGYIQVVHSDDTPRRLHLSGRMGAKVKEMICRLTISGPRKEAVKAGAYWAPSGPAVEPNLTPSSRAPV